MKNVFSHKIILSSLLISFITGCAIFTGISPLESGAETVFLTRDAAPSECQFIRQIFVNDTNGVTTPYTSDKNLDISQIHDIKNRAIESGANFVGNLKQVEMHRHYKGGTAYVDAETSTGLAYKCPPAAFSKVTPFSGWPTN